MHDHDAVTAGRSRMLVIAVASILLLSAIAHGDAYPLNDRPKNRHIARGTCYLSHSEQETNSTTSFANFTPQRQRQQRQKSLNRRPRNYWMDPENLRAELCDFWQKCGVPIETNGEQPQLPTIPNEVLLMHFGRNDLRAAISKNGGRETVSNLLGGTPIMRGRWREAVTSSPALQQLLRVDPSFSVDHPPRVLTSSAVASQGDGVAGTARWSHSDSRNRLGYWTLQTVIRELYEYVDKYREQYNRPSVWMPRPSEMAKQGRDDLRQAMNRFGGARLICRAAGMVPHQEWFFFDGQLQLLVELKRYLDEHGDGDYKSFPTVSDIQRNGYHELHSLIQYYGGRKFLSARLSMSEPTKGKLGHDTGTTDRNYYANTILEFGHFDLEFAIHLLTFVREDHLKRNPPLKNPVLSMPSRSRILAHAERGAWLGEKIDEFGGDENVARRLGLALFASSMDA